MPPVEPCAGDLNQSEPGTCARHLAGQRHRDQHVDLSEMRDDCGLVRHDDLAGYREISAYRVFKAGGKRPDNRDRQQG